MNTDTNVKNILQKWEVADKIKSNTFFGIYYTTIIQTEIKNEKRAKSS